MIDIDKKSAQIVRELQTDGRISMTELGERVGLSPSACLRRVQELERTGVIKGYRAVVDPAVLGTGFSTFLAVGLSRHDRESQLIFERAVARAPEVRECHNITGTVEYILRIEVADIEAYKRFHTEVIGAIEVVKTLTTYVIMSSPKDERA